MKVIQICDKYNSMKKVNFFNFPSISIDIHNNSDKSKKVCSNKRRALIKITTFSSWCKSANLKKDKFNMKVIFKAD